MSKNLESKIVMLNGNRDCLALCKSRHNLKQLVRCIRRYLFHLIPIVYTNVDAAGNNAPGSTAKVTVLCATSKIYNTLKMWSGSDTLARAVSFAITVSEWSKCAESTGRIGSHNRVSNPNGCRK